MPLSPWISTVDVLLAATFSMMASTSDIFFEFPMTKRSESRWPTRIWRALRASRAVWTLTIASATSSVTRFSSKGFARK